MNIDNFTQLTNKYLKIYKNKSNLQILEINYKNKVFYDFLNLYFKKNQYILTDLKDYIFGKNEGEKNSIDLILKLIYMLDEKNNNYFDIIYLNIDFPIYNIIFIMENLYNLLKFNGIFIYNNCCSFNYDIKTDIDTFIQIKLKDKLIDLKINGPLLIYSKNNFIEKFNKSEKNIYDYIKNIKFLFFEEDLTQTIKNKLIFDIQFQKPKNKLLISNKNDFIEFNKYIKKFNIFYNQYNNKLLTNIIDNLSFSKKIPKFREEFINNFKLFYKNSLNPIFFDHFYNFIELSNYISKYNIEVVQIYLLNLINIKKKKIIYLHTIHNMHHSYLTKNVFPYILIYKYKKYLKDEKSIQKFRKMIKKNPTKIIESRNEVSHRRSAISYLSKFKDKNVNNIEHMLPFEYSNKNNNINLSTPSKRISFELKKSSDLIQIKKQMKNLEIKSFDIMKLDAFFGKGGKYPKTKYYIHSIFNYIVFMLNFQSKGGTTFFIISGLYDEITLDFIQILNKYYKNIKLKYYNYQAESKIDISYFILCEKFLGISKNELNEFNNILDILYENNSDLGKKKQKISNFLNKKSYNIKERNILKNKIIDFNSKIIKYNIFKIKYFINLVKFFKNKKDTKNVIDLKKYLLFKQINTYIICLNDANYLEYKKYF